MHFNHEEAHESSSDDMLADEYSPVVDQGTFQFGFGSSRPEQTDKYGNPVITIIDRSGIHEIGVRWCCCPNAAERDMQLMVAGLQLLKKLSQCLAVVQRLMQHKSNKLDNNLTIIYVIL